MMASEGMMSRCLLLVVCVVVLVISIGSAQNETWTAVTRLERPITLDPRYISPDPGPTSVFSQQIATTLPPPSDGETNTHAPQTTMTDTTHTGVTLTEATNPAKAVDVPGTDQTQNDTTEATRLWTTTERDITAQTTVVGPPITAEATTVEAITAHTTAVGPVNSTEATTSEATIVETTAVGPNNITEVTTVDTNTMGPNNTTEDTTSPISLQWGSNTTTAIDSNSTNVTSDDATTWTEHTTGLYYTTVTDPSNFTSGLGAISDGTATTSTVSPVLNLTCNQTDIVCLNGGACYEEGNRPMCRCPNGWTGTKCESDIDECNSTGVQSAKCDSHAMCSNSQGGYICSCEDGYDGDGFNCKYDNLCDTMPCANGFCLSRPNNYECHCPDGWRGSNCTQDVDECAENTHRCWEVRNAVCVNTAGSYICQCPMGYYGNAAVKCTEDILYPSGSQNVSLMKEKNAFMSVDVAGGFPYFGQMFYRMQISSNGIVSFGPDDLLLTIPSRPKPELLSNFSNVSIFAPYWSLVDTTDQNDSSIVQIDVYDFWNSTLNLTSSPVRSLVVNHIQLYGNDSFEPQFAVVVTWRNVVPYPAEVYAGWENATFQAVLATDGSKSAAIINYAGDQMLWNPRSDNRTVIIGFTSPNGEVDTFNNYTVDLYRPDLSTNVDKPGRFYFTLGQRQNNSHVPCIAWYQRQADPLLSSLVDALVPCPCTLQQAMNDWRFVNDSQEASCVRHRLKTISAVQLCCYDSVGQALLFGLGGGYSRMMGDEADGRKKCCKDAELCHLFYEKRPTYDCRKYVAPSTGAVWGDPHFSSFYGMQFSFNGLGEYSLFQSMSGMFQLQGRFERPRIVFDNGTSTSSKNVATLTAVAVKYGNNTALELKVTNGVLTLYNSSGVYSLPLQVDDLPGALAGRSTNSTILIHFKSDVVIQVSVEMGFMKIAVQLPRALLEMTDALGLLMRQCQAPSSVFLPSVDNLDAFKYFRYCMLTKEQSVFFYNLDGTTYESFLNPNFIPIFFTIYNQSAFNLPFCGSSASCFEDWSKTNDTSRAVVSKVFEDDLVKSRSMLENYPPMFSAGMPMVVDATVGQEMRLMLDASDREKQMIRYQIQTIINNTEWKLVNNSFVWNPSQSTFNNTSLAPFLSFFAVDDSGSSSLYWPYVKFCPCSTDVASHCSFDYPPKLDHQTTTDRLVIGRCQCNRGLMGDWCAQPMDVCALGPCYPGTTCTSNATDVQVLYQCGPCLAGLIQDGNQCYDQNECLLPINRGCTTCSNQLGTFMCHCDPGFALAKNKTTCLDVDECSRDSRLCSKDGEFCHNKPGSYECRCQPDYYNNNSVCIYAPIKYAGKITFKAFQNGTNYVNWRDTLADNKSAIFREVADNVEAQVKTPYLSLKGFVGTKVTQLQKGSIQVNYDLYFTPEANVNSSYLDELMQRFLATSNCDMNGPDCQMAGLVGVIANQSNVFEKDLCLSSWDNACDTRTMNCRTEGGRALCACKEGWQRIAENVEACEDFDECAPETENCHMNMSLCINTVGSYFCSCVSGFYMNNGSCSDVCDPNPCMNDGLCSSKGEDFACQCYGIWTGLNCTEENPEAVKLRKIAIGVGVGLGIVCIILAIALIICCIKRHRSGSSYQCATSSNTRGNYAGRKSINVHNWDPEEMDYKTNGNRMTSLDREAQPQSKTFTGNENPAYSDLTLERDQRQNTAPKKSSENYF